MKKLLSITCIILGLTFATNTSCFAQEGTFSLGASVIYGTGAGGGSSSLSNDLGLRVDGNYAITDQIRAAADFGFFFPKSEGGAKFTVTEFDINGHYLFVQDPSYNVYGLAGLNFASVKITVDSGAGSFSGSSSETGLNLGIGGEYGVGFGNLFGELKYAGLGGDADELVIGAGLRFALN